MVGQPLQVPDKREKKGVLSCSLEPRLFYTVNAPRKLEMRASHVSAYLARRGD